MAQIIGQIESLKRLRDTLNQQGIKRFNSIGSIRRFQKNYALEKQAIYREAALNVANELDLLKEAYNHYQEQYQQSKNRVKEDTSFELSILNEKLNRLKLILDLIEHKLKPTKQIILLKLIQELTSLKTFLQH